MGSTAEKLKYLNETKAEIKNALETPYNVMRDYPELIKKYIDNQPTKVVTDGICGNAVDVPVKAIEINGNIRQETTEGYNLLNVPAEYTILSTEAYKKVPISLKANYTYTIKIGQINTDNTDVTSVLFNFTYNQVEISNAYAYVKLSDLKGTYTPASDVDAVFIYSGDSYAQGAKINTTYKNLMIYEGTEDKPYELYTGGIPSPNPDYPQEITNVGGYDNLFDKNNIISGSYVSDGNGAFLGNSTSKRTDYIEIQANSYYYIYSDKPSGNWGAWYDKDKKFISGITLGGKKEIVVNSPANAKYMAFTISYLGNLTDYSKIKINEAAIKIKQSGYNIANLDRETFTLAGITVTNNGDGSFTFNGTSTSAADLILTKAGAINSNIYQFEDAKYLLKTFVISGSISNPNNKAVRIVCMGRSNNTNNYGMLHNTLTQNIFSELFTMHSTDTLGRIEMYINPEITFNNYTIKILLAKTDNINLPYELYHEPIITPINLQGNVLSKVGNVKDILKVNRNGKVEIKKNIGKVVLDGTENWVTLTTQKGDNTSYFYCTKTDMKKASSIICNQFKNRAVWSTDVEGIQSITDNLIRLRINTSRASTVSELKAWLAAQKEAGTPVIVYYELATPQIITLPSISPIELWQGTNIFSLITNLDTEIELEYIVDKDSVLNEVQTAMLEAEI